MLQERTSREQRTLPSPSLKLRLIHEDTVQKNSAFFGRDNVIEAESYVESDSGREKSVE